jgi:hypothetical protein
MASTVDIMTDLGHKQQVKVRHPDGSYSVLTGYPDPLRQVAGQNRCSSGYTQIGERSWIMSSPAWRG